MQWTLLSAVGRLIGRCILGKFMPRELFSPLSIALAFITVLPSPPALAQLSAAANQDHAPSGSSEVSTPQPQIPRPSLPPAFDPKTRTPLYETIQEDWSSLATGTSKLEPEPPLVAQTEEQDAFTRTLVMVKWRPGDPIDLWIVLPKGVRNPPVVLYLYGADQGTDRFRDDGWAKRVTAGGVGAVGFVAALTGPRFHDRPLNQWMISELQESLGSTVHDVKFILDYLAQRGDVDMNRVGMFGESSGATVAILAAAADPRIKAVDALEPWGDWPDFLAKSPVIEDDPKRADYGKPEFLAHVANLDPVKWLPELKIPVRIQLVRDSEPTPAECKEKIGAAAPKQAEVVRFASFKDLGTREGQGRLFRWIKDKLRDQTNTPADKISSTSSVASGNAPTK